MSEEKTTQNIEMKAHLIFKNWAEVSEFIINLNDTATQCFGPCPEFVDEPYAELTACDSSASRPH